MQPFRSGNEYVSRLCPGVQLLLKEDRIELRSQEPLYALSSAVWPGGFSEADTIVNWKVPLTYQCDDPVRDIREQCVQWGYDSERTVGFITAAKLTHAAVQESEGDGFKLLCCTTSGTKNAARAGMPRKTFPSYMPGTINTMIVIDGELSQSAMVNAVITATEAKTAALQKLGIIERANGESATGTTTDAIAIAITQNKSWGVKHVYAGSATSLGCTLAEAVYRSVYVACKTQDED